MHKKIWLTLSLVLFFSFVFKYYFDFQILTKLIKRPSQEKLDSLNRQAQINLSAETDSTLLSPAQNILHKNPLTNISEIIHAQEKTSSHSQDQSYIAPSQNPNFLPIRDWSEPFIEIGAKAAIITDEKAEKLLYQKNISEKLPIASLTKIMTALVILENYPLDELVKISQNAIKKDGDAGKLVAGEEIIIEDLLKVLLIESSNDAAEAFKEHLALKGANLIQLMNQKAQELNLVDTKFSSASGLEYKNNYSTAHDLAKLMSYSLSNEKLWKILGTESIEISSVNKSIVHRLNNSNELLGKTDGVIGGKTGFTDEAGECLIVVVKINNDTKIISVILGSNDRFGEMDKLINWVKKAYRFNN